MLYNSSVWGGIAHVVRPSDGPDEVVVGAESAVSPQLESRPGEEWSLSQDDLHDRRK